MAIFGRNRIRLARYISIFVGTMRESSFSVRRKEIFGWDFPLFICSAVPKTAMTLRDAGTGGQEGQPPPSPFTRRGKGALSMPWRNSELPEMLVQFFYEFASENARNAVIELQE